MEEPTVQVKQSTRTIIGIGGMSGSGKSTYRQEHFPNAISIDIADIYKRYRCTIKPMDAWRVLLIDLKDLIDSGKTEVVVEAAFTTKQKEMMRAFGELIGAEVKIIEMPVLPKEEAICRVRDEHAKRYHEDPWWWKQYTAYRLRIIKNWGHEDFQDAEIDESARVFQSMKLSVKRGRYVS